MKDVPFSTKTNTRTQLHAVYTVQSLQLRTVEIQCIAQKISRSYFITVHVDEIRSYSYWRKIRREIRRFKKKMNAYDGYSILSSNYGFRTKKTIYPSFQHKTDYLFSTRRIIHMPHLIRWFVRLIHNTEFPSIAI